MQADKTDYAWYPEWYYFLYFIIPNNFSRAASATFSVDKDYSKNTLVKTNTPPLIYNTMFNDMLFNTSLNSTFKNTEENVNGTINLTQQNVQTAS